MKRGYVSPDTGLVFWDWNPGKKGVSGRWLTPEKYERYREARKQRYEKSKGLVLASVKRYAEANRLAVKERVKRWRSANADTLREKARAYRLANKDKISEYLANRYRKDERYRKRVLVISSLRSALARGASKTQSWKESVRFLEDTKPDAVGYEVDHLIPVSRFDDVCTHYSVNSPENVRWIPRALNRSKANSMPSEDEIKSHLKLVDSWRAGNFQKNPMEILT